MSNIDALAEAWLEAKSAENTAKAKRLKIEAELAEALEAKDEGSITHKLDDHKVTLTQPVYRKLDQEMWPSVMYKVPEQMRPVKTKLEADPAGMKWLANNEPEMWVKIAPAFTTSKGKIGIKVEKLKNGN